MSSVSKPRVRHNRHKQGLNLTLEKLSADFRYIENCSDQIIYVGIDEVNRSSITNLDSLVFECVLRCKVIYPHNSKPVRSYDYNRNTFFKRYPVSKVYIVNDDMDSVLAVYPITEASLMADGWMLKYEEDTTVQP